MRLQNSEFLVSLGGDVCKADEGKKNKSQEKNLPLSTHFFALVQHHMRALGCRAALGVLVSPSGLPAQGSAQPQAYSSTGKPGKAAGSWSWGAPEEATDGEAGCVINIAGEPGSAVQMSPHRMAAGMRGQWPPPWPWHRSGDAGNTRRSSWQSPA